jgi:hypothetical protein
VNDVLQALGALLYRTPLEGARHGALQWLQARGVVADARPVGDEPLRPDGDRALHRELATRLEAALAAPHAPDPDPRLSAAAAS